MEKKQKGRKDTKCRDMGWGLWEGGTSPEKRWSRRDSFEMSVTRGDLRNEESEKSRGGEARGRRGLGMFEEVEGIWGIMSQGAGQAHRSHWDHRGQNLPAITGTVGESRLLP